MAAGDVGVEGRCEELGGEFEPIARKGGVWHPGEAVMCEGAGVGQGIEEGEEGEAHDGECGRIRGGACRGRRKRAKRKG